MHQTEFKPETFKLKIVASESIDIRRWSDILAFIVTEYAKLLTAQKGVYIGHIKALFEGVGQEYIKLSIYKEDIPVDIEFVGDSHYKELDLIINSIVYGVEQTLSLNALDQACQKYQNSLIKYEIEIVHHH